jgi:hypothetical protein
MFCSSRWVAKLWRKVCGVTRLVISAAVFGNEVDMDQHLMKCIVDSAEMMLAVPSLEITCKG